MAQAADPSHVCVLSSPSIISLSLTKNVLNTNYFISLTDSKTIT